MIKYLIEKEFKQFMRNPFLPRLVVMMPIVMMLVFPWAANQEVKNINLSVVDNDHTQYSQRLIHKIAASGYFNYTDYSNSYEQGMEAIASGKADVILEIPVGFERDLLKEGNSRLLISANAVNGTKGSFSGNYLTLITRGYMQELQEESGLLAIPSSVPVIEVVQQNRFNARMDYKVFMVPALVVTLLTLICGFLPALNIVSEKEAGTMEQMNVTPVTKFTFIIAKLIPYWIIGFIVLTICLGIAYWAYGLLPAGNVLGIYLSALIYILAISGFGLIISNHSSTMQQAMFVMFFFMLIFILLSGLFTPINSMPGWAQVITYINPLKYFILIMRHIYLKGSSVLDLWQQIGALLGFAGGFNIWAVWSYKKTES